MKARPEKNHVAVFQRLNKDNSSASRATLVYGVLWRREPRTARRQSA